MNVKYLSYSASLLVVLFIFWIYWPGVNGPFVFDDFPNIVENSKVHVLTPSFKAFIDAAFSTSTGPLSRPIPMMSFAINHFYGGLDEYGFKVTNIILHCLNAALLWFVSRKILGRIFSSEGDSDQASIAATVCVLLWVFHPMHVTSVLYVVQRMVEMSALFGLLAVYFYLVGRERKSVLHAFICDVVCGICVVAAVLCKENLVVLIPLIAMLERVLFSNQSEILSIRKYTSILKAMQLLGILILLAYIGFKFPSFIKGYEFRPFTMEERLLTQSRILWSYLGQILLPDISRMHLFHDEIVVSKSILSPIVTLISILSWILMAFIAYFVRNRSPLFTIAIGWFLIGHLIESSFISLELMHAHRNYFPMMGIFILLGFLSAHLYARSKFLMICVLLAITLMLGLATRHRSMDWATWEVLVVTEAEKNSTSARSQYEAGRYYYWLVEKAGKDHYREEDYNKAIFYFERGTESSQSSLASLAAMIRLNDSVGKPIRKEWLTELLLRIGTRRPDPNDINKVGDLFQCKLVGKCQIDSGLLSEVAATVIESKSLPAFTRSAIASGASAVALKEGRIDFATYYSVYALETSPKTFEFMKNSLSLARIVKNVSLANQLMSLYSVNFHDDAQKSLMKSEYEMILKEASEGDKRVQ